MKNKFKKLMATTLLSMTATSAIGCATTNTKIAQKINHGVNDFVSSINKLDYVDTNSTKSNLGKIVSAANDTAFLNKMTSSTNIENTITKPSERNDNFKLYNLSSSPYITFVSDDNVSLSIQFSTDKIETTSDEIDEKINKLILKRAILMVYVNEIYNGNVTLSDENKKAINAYVNVIKENASFLNGNRGMVKNQLNMASNLLNTKTSENIVNYYIIKSGEALKIRSNKIDSTISAIDSIISILENNLSPSSCYYQNNLTNSYENMISNLNNSNNTSNENTELAKSIAESINLIQPQSQNNNLQTTQNINQNQELRTKESNQQLSNNSRNLNNENNSSVLNKNIDNSQNSNQINNSQIQNNHVETNNLNNNIKTLEETDNSINAVPENSSDFSRMTPSQRARARRAQRELRAKQRQEQEQKINATNPTTTPNSINNNTIRANRSRDKLSTENLDSQTNSNHIHNKATRVPYKISNQSNVD